MKEKIKDWILLQTSLTGIDGLVIMLLVGFLELSFMIFLMWILLKTV